jgi:Protein of unknown function (DUF2958)
MKLLTKEIEAKLLKTPLYSTEKLDVKPIIVKFFTPDSSWTWYVVEANKISDVQNPPYGEWEFFGLVDGLEKEWGYFRLSELQSVRGNLGLPIERDMYFDGMVADVNTNEIRRAATA